MIERMLDDSETAELRSLRERAYGRDGRLTGEDVTRLHELETMLRPAAAVAPAAPVAGIDPEIGPSKNSAIGPVESRPGSGVGLIAEPFEASDDPAPNAESEAPVPPRRRRWLAFAGIGAVLIGLAAGWAIWGWNSAEFALATTHSEQRAELEASGDFDPGTVSALSENHGVVLWRAERHEGDQLCVIATSPDATQSGCGEMEPNNLGSANVSISVPEDDELAGQMLNAFLMVSAAGEIVPIVQIWDQSGSNWESQFSEDELAALDRLEAEGFDRGSLSVLGYDGDRPVWTSWGNEMCLIVESDDGIVKGCSSFAETPQAELVITASIGGVPTQYIVRQSETRGQQLTVVKLPEATMFDIGVGEQIEIDDKTGDTNG